MSNQKFEKNRSQQVFPNKKRSMCVFSWSYVRTFTCPFGPTYCGRSVVRFWSFGRTLLVVRSYVRSYVRSFGRTFGRTLFGRTKIVPHLVPHEALNEALFLYDRKLEYIF